MAQGTNWSCKSVEAINPKLKLIKSESHSQQKPARPEVSAHAHHRLERDRTGHKFNMRHFRCSLRTIFGLHLRCSDEVRSETSMQYDRVRRCHTLSHCVTACHSQRRARG